VYLKTRPMNGKRLFKYLASLRGDRRSTKQSPLLRLPRPFGARNDGSKRKAQSTLELTVAMIAVFILLLASVKTFVWVNQRMVLRQEDYEGTRVAAASNNPGVQVDESDYPLLDIFGENR